MSTKNNTDAPAPVTPAEQKLVSELYSRARTRILANMPFFGHLLMRLDLEATRHVQLAAVTPTNKLYLNADWAVATTNKELAATAVHEMLHPAMLTFERQGARMVPACGPDGEPVSLWNCATDYANNLIIRDMIRTSQQGQDTLLDPGEWKPPGLIDEKYRNWSAEQIYDDLLANLQPPPQGGKGKKGGRYHPGLDGSKADMQGASENMSANEKKAQSQYWAVALLEAAQIHQQALVSKGTPLPGAILKLIEQITDPKIPWQDVLSRWVGENGRRADHTYLRPARRSEAAGEILPSLKRSGASDVVVLWDTSGSMNGSQSLILSEVLGICNDMSLSLRIICCDDAIRSDTSNVNEVSDIEQHVKGGGGSSFIPAFSLLSEEGYSGVLVVFTDGYIRVPSEKPECLQGLLWVVWGHGSVDPTRGSWGETLFVDAEGNAL